MHASVIRFSALGFCTAIALSACGSSGGDQPVGGNGGGQGGVVGGAGGGGGGAGGSTATGPKANGLFDIKYVNDPGNVHTEVGGFMYDGPKPDLVVWDKKKTEGDCWLQTPRTPFCESCASGEVCVETNVCRAQPLSHNVGDVTLTGLTPAGGASKITLFKVEPTAGAETGVNYACTDTLPVPPCTPGGSISLAATGGAVFSAFTISAQCIAPLAVSMSKILLETGKGVTLTWTAGTVSTARINVKFDLSHHGGSKGQILCDTADSGSLQVSATLMDSLIALGVTGFPSVNITRVLTGTTPVGSGQAQVKLYSDILFTAELPGLVSCQTSADCTTAGQTCLEPAQMCGIACTTNADCPTGQTCQTSTKSCK